MRKFVVSIPEGATECIKEAIESCKDVAFGVSKFPGEREVNYSVLVNFSNKTKVHEGNYSFIPSGRYIYKKVGYKYTTIVYKNSTLKVDSSFINKVIFTYKEDDE